MKILVISKKLDDGSDSAIDLWRIKRPILELQKHVDWEFTFQDRLITDYHGCEEQPDEFIRQYGADLVKELGKYDLIFTSYSTSPHVFTLLWGANKQYGTKFIIDIDDDLYDVDPGNFSFWKSAGWQGHEFLKTAASLAPYICTTNDDLAKKLKRKSEVDVKTFVIPNYIADTYPDQEVDNGDDIVLGFFGGASHYLDLHETGLLLAVQKLMHEDKRVRFTSCGQPVDMYLPKARVKIIEPEGGTDWPAKLLPSLNLDIVVAPLLDTEFNQYKSDIKWQEATRMGSAFVGSKVGPYKSLDKSIARVVPNAEEAWYIALKDLVDDDSKRKAMVKEAKKALKDRRLETNWEHYKSMFEEVCNANY
jgi:hypothetical protein